MALLEGKRGPTGMKHLSTAVRGLISRIFSLIRKQGEREPPLTFERRVRRVAEGIFIPGKIGFGQEGPSL